MAPLGCSAAHFLALYDVIGRHCKRCLHSLYPWVPRQRFTVWACSPRQPDFIAAKTQRQLGRAAAARALTSQLWEEGTISSSFLLVKDVNGNKVTLGVTRACPGLGG